MECINGVRIPRNGCLCLIFFIVHNVIVWVGVQGLHSHSLWDIDWPAKNQKGQHRLRSASVRSIPLCCIPEYEGDCYEILRAAAPKTREIKRGKIEIWLYRFGTARLVADSTSFPGFFFCYLRVLSSSFVHQPPTLAIVENCACSVWASHYLRLPTSLSLAVT